MSLQKITKKKGYLTVNSFFIADKSVLFWKTISQRTFISKEEKRVPGFKAQRDRLILLFVQVQSGL